MQKPSLQVPFLVVPSIHKIFKSKDGFAVQFRRGV